MPALQALTGGKLLFSPRAPLALLTRFMALPRRVTRYRASSGALPHTPLPFGSQKEAKSNFAAQRVKGACPTYYNFSVNTITS